MRVAVRIAIGAVFVIVLVAGAALWGLHLVNRAGPLETETAVVIPRGSGLDNISAALTDAGVVDQPLVFVAAAKMTGANRALKAGEYAFPAHVSIAEAFRILQSGKTVVRRFTVPEGLTSSQVVRLMRDEPSLAGEITDEPAEGSLLPETYHYSWGDGRAEMLKRMQAAMRTALQAAWSKRSLSLPLDTPEQAVILASIVEKETSVPRERAKVAGVFVNRLLSNMKLQSDPTVVYALTQGDGALGRPLTRADWKFESPYNTYVIDGLPPAPIANPGKASLEAVMNPEQHEFVYFVADGSGGHAFAKTLAEHNRNVTRWREVMKRQGDEGAAE
jgi:UPF0755 protein